MSVSLELEPVQVFISSTFRDTVAERDHLVTVVFPELRERLSWLGLELVDVDLRWGVPSATAEGEPANSWAYCRRWIERTEPFFIAIIGQRYGSQPDSSLDDNDYAFEGMSITEMEIQHAVLRQTLRRRSFFYMRNTAVPDETDESVYRQFVDVEQQSLLENLKRKIRDNSGRPVRDYACQWSRNSFTKMEAFGQMVLDDLWSGVLRDERFLPRAVWREALGNAANVDSFIANEAEPIPESLWSPLVDKWRSDSEASGARQVARFLGSATRWFNGRDSELSELLEFALNDPIDESPGLLSVLGEEGIGKTALLAAFVQELASRGHEVAGSAVAARDSTNATTEAAIVLAHFTSETATTSAESMAESFLELLPSECAPQTSVSDSYETFAQSLARLVTVLSGYTSGRRLIVVVDDADLLDIRWIPGTVAKNVRLVLSATDESELKNRFWGDEPIHRQLRLRLRELKPEVVSRIIPSYFAHYCKELEPHDLAAVAQIPAAGNPLYLLVLLSELRRLGGDDLRVAVPELIRDLPRRYSTPSEVFDWVLDQAEAHFGDITRDFCACLAVSRGGLPSRVLADVVARRQVSTDSRAVCARLERWMRPYLNLDRGRIRFSHGEFWEAARRLVPFDHGKYHADIGECLDSRNGRYHLDQARDWASFIKLAQDHDLLATLQQVEAAATPEPELVPGSWFRLDHTSTFRSEFSCVRCGYYSDTTQHSGVPEQCPECGFQHNEQKRSIWRQLREELRTLQRRSGSYTSSGAVGAKQASPAVEAARAAIAARYAQALERGEVPPDPGHPWFTQHVNLGYQSGGYNVYCRRCGSQDSDPGPPPPTCPNCGAGAGR